MRVLWLSVELPDVDGQGGQRRQFHQLRALHARGHEITVVIPAGSGSSPALQRFVRVRRPRLHVRGRAVPFALRRLHALVADPSWDAVVVSHLGSLWMLPERSAPVLLDLHNVFSAWHRQAGREERARAALAEEEAGLRRADAVSTCSDLETRRLRQAHPLVRPADAFTAPLGVDPAEWPEQLFDRTRPRVALFGGWSWEPNRRGLLWFADEVWPRVRQAVPDADGVVAGSGVPKDRALPPGMSSVGRVPDLAGFTASATVVAVPVIAGVGAAMKYAESLATGAAVAATPDAAGAFAPAELPASSLLVSGDAAEWASWIIARLAARGVEPAPAAGRAHALTALNWNRAVEPIDAWLRKGER